MSEFFFVSFFYLYHLGGDVAQQGGAGLLDVALHVLSLLELIAHRLVRLLLVMLALVAGFLVEVSDGGPEVQGPSKDCWYI